MEDLLLLRNVVVVKELAARQIKQYCPVFTESFSKWTTLKHTIMKAKFPAKRLRLEWEPHK